MTRKAAVKRLEKQLQSGEQDSCNCIKVSWSDEEMEESAIGSVCKKCGLPILSRRIISIGENGAVKVHDEKASTSAH